MAIHARLCRSLFMPKLRLNFLRCVCASLPTFPNFSRSFFFFCRISSCSFEDVLDDTNEKEVTPAEDWCLRVMQRR